MRTTTALKNAWLLTWEGTEGPVRDPDRKIVAILSSRHSPSLVADVVDILYCRSVGSAYDMALLANKRKLREQQYMRKYSTPTRQFYGRNPCVFARRVTNLSITKDESRRTELIRWTEPAVFQNAESGSGLVESEPSRDCQHARSLDPLALDIYGREVLSVRG